MITLREIARALGGEASGGQVKAPAPGHSAKDRSLVVGLSDTEDGFVVHGFGNGADDLAYKDYVRQRLGLPSFKPNGSGAPKKTKLREIVYAYRDPQTCDIRYRKTRREFTDGSKTGFFVPKGRELAREERASYSEADPSERLPIFVPLCYPGSKTRGQERGHHLIFDLGVKDRRKIGTTL